MQRGVSCLLVPLWSGCCAWPACIVMSLLQKDCRCVAMGCSVLQRVAVCCSVLQCVAMCCSVLQCVIVCCSEVQSVAVNKEREIAELIEAIEELELVCAAVCCSVLQCVAENREREMV